MAQLRINFISFGGFLGGRCRSVLGRVDNDGFDGAIFFPRNRSCPPVVPSKCVIEIDFNRVLSFYSAFAVANFISCGTRCGGRVDEFSPTPGSLVMCSLAL